MKRKRLFLFVVFVVAVLFAVSCGDSSSTASGGDNDTIGGTGHCGNGTLEADKGEVCDPGIEYHCWEAGHYYPENKAFCNSDCKGWDTSRCIKRDDNDTCGDGKLDPQKEMCEMGDTKDCTEFTNAHFTGGAATCKRDCRGWDTTPCTVGGNKVCSLMFACAEQCSDQACVDECIKDAKEGEDKKVQDLWNCYISASCSGSEAEKEKCLAEKCGDLYYTCYPNKRCGNGKIDEGEVCEKNDTKPCIEVGPDEFQDMNDAICNSTCSGYDTYSCVPKDALACFQIYDCVVACKGDKTCEDECKAKGYMAATEKYDTMTQCYQEKCGSLTPDDTCIKENCQFQTDACHTHATCGNEHIDPPYEICERNDKKDCGEVDPNKYESGTANAYCDMNCAGWTTTGCYGFCSCEDVKQCVETKCGGYKDGDRDCIHDCQSLGSYLGKNQNKAWVKCVESLCIEQDGKKECGWDCDRCIKDCTQGGDGVDAVECGSDHNDKCSY